jgi:hypothetical protein
LINLGFLLRERLATVLIIPSSWGSQLGGCPTRIKLFFWRRCQGKRRLLQEEFRTHILYFVLVLLYFSFACIVFSKNTQKISFLYRCFYLLAFSLVRMSNPEVEVRTFKQEGGRA